MPPCVTDLSDPGLKEHIAGLQAIRDLAQADTMRAQAVLDSPAQQPTTTVLRKFAATARKRMQIEGGGYRRDHLRALAQRVEVGDDLQEPLLDSGVLTLPEQALRVGGDFSRFGESDRGVWTDREQLLLALELVPETP